MITGILQITIIGTDTGPFNIYTDADGYVSPIATDVLRDELLSGYILSNIPNDATELRVVSVGECKGVASLNIII